MTALGDAFPIPVLGLNKYLWHSMCQIDTTLPTQYDGITPFFPLADSRGGDAPWDDKPYIVYDNMFKMRPGSFPHIHRVQAMYFVRGSAKDVVVWTNAISQILDRGDSAAQDANNYLASSDPGHYFHRFKVFQIDMVSDQRQDLAVRQYYTASMIVEVDYHITNMLGFD